MPIKDMMKQVKSDYMADKNKRLEEMAKRNSIKTGKHNGQIDAFRHIYSAADSTLKNGSIITKIAGSSNEWLTEWIDSNPKDEWQMDEYNNAIGRALGERARAENWTSEKLEQEVAKTVVSGQAKVLTRGNDPDTPTGYPGYGASTPKDKIVLPDAKAQQQAVARGAKMFSSQGRKYPNPTYRTPPIVVQPKTPPESSNLLGSILDYFRKK